MFVYFIISGLWKSIKIRNGQDAGVSFKGKEKISVDELYDNMKKDFALQSLVNMIDTYIYETEFKDFVAQTGIDIELFLNYFLYL